jgi:predicted dehydrogenase
MVSRYSRREFLQTGAFAAGGVAVGKRVILEEREPVGEPRQVPPSDQVRFGIIGVGMQGSGLLSEALGLEGTECVAAADLYDGRHTLARERAGNPELSTTRRYQDILDRQDIDCVIVAVPDHHHHRVVLDALSAGKDVYCEKPMTHRAEEGADIVEAARQHGRIVQVGSQRVSSALCRKAFELYQDGAIGDVSMVELSLGRNSPTGAWQYPPPPDLSPETLDWDAWLGSAPRIPFDANHFARWRCWREYGTGVAGDLMVHLISGMMRSLGWNKPPNSAQSLGGITRWRDGRNMPDLHAVLFNYDGVPVYVRLGLGTSTPETMRLMGPRGILEAGGTTLVHSPQEGVDRSPSYYASSFPGALRSEYRRAWHAEHGRPPGQDPIDATTEYRSNHWDDVRPHMWDFIDAVRSRGEVAEDVVFGNHAAIACHMANESYFRSGTVAWDAASGTIVDAG